jgi:hypothetical protein
VGRALCNNDTIGRLAYQYGLHEKAIFNYHDDIEVKNWHPRYNFAPPKALADLFEAYVGALYEEQGWDTVMTWLIALYKPLVEVATEDFKRNNDSARSSPESKSFDPLLAEVVVFQERLLDYLSFKGSHLVDRGQEALDALPPATQFFFSSDGSLANDSDKAELATHLINFWICNIFMRVYPQLLQATYKGAHLITASIYNFINRVVYHYINMKTTSGLHDSLRAKKQSVISVLFYHFHPSSIFVISITTITIRLLDDSFYWCRAVLLLQRLANAATATNLLWL